MANLLVTMLDKTGVQLDSLGEYNGTDRPGGAAAQRRVDGAVSLALDEEGDVETRKTLKHLVAAAVFAGFVATLASIAQDEVAGPPTTTANSGVVRSAKGPEPACG